MDPSMAEMFSTCENIVTCKIEWMQHQMFSETYQIIELKLFLEEKVKDSSINPIAKSMLRFLVESQLSKFNC